MGALGALITTLGTFLFYIRARGVFSRSKRAKYLFTILWVLTTLGIIFTTPFSFSGASVDPTGLFIVSDIAKFRAVIGPFLVCAFDAVVLVSITRRVTAITWTERKGTLSLFFSSGEGQVSKALTCTSRLCVM